SGAPERNGRTSIPARAMSSTWLSTPDQSKAPPGLAWTRGQTTGIRMLSTPPRFNRSSCPGVGCACGTTPQNFDGTACALDAIDAEAAAETARAAVRARIFLLIDTPLRPGRSARTRRDGRLRALTPASLPGHEGHGDRGEDGDGDQDRHQRRRAVVALRLCRGLVARLLPLRILAGAVAWATLPGAPVAVALGGRPTSIPRR